MEKTCHQLGLLGGAECASHPVLPTFLAKRPSYLLEGWGEEGSGWWVAGRLACLHLLTPVSRRQGSSQVEDLLQARAHGAATYLLM